MAKTQIEYQGRKYPALIMHIKNPEWEDTVLVTSESLNRALGDESAFGKEETEIDERTYHYVPDRIIKTCSEKEIAAEHLDMPFELIEDEG